MWITKESRKRMAAMHEHDGYLTHFGLRACPSLPSIYSPVCASLFGGVGRIEAWLIDCWLAYHRALVAKHQRRYFPLNVAWTRGAGRKRSSGFFFCDVKIGFSILYFNDTLIFAVVKAYSLWSSKRDYGFLECTLYVGAVPPLQSPTLSMI